MDKIFEVEDALTDPDAFDWPRCPTCGEVMRLVAIEPNNQDAHISVHTYECTCDAVAVDEVSNN